MSRRFLCLCLCGLLFLGCQHAAAANSVSKSSVSITVGNITRTVTMVKVDLRDPTIQIESQAAQGRIGTTDELKNIAQDTGGAEVLAAINGTPFRAYSDMQPQGILQSKGQFLHLGSGASIGFSPDNEVLVDSLRVKVIGSINGSQAWPNQWSVQQVNHAGENEDTLFTPAYGTSTGAHNKTSVIVENGRVAEIKTGQARIPSAGFTITFATAGYASKFKVGDAAAYTLRYEDKDGTPIDWSRMYATIGAGPSLVRNGVITADAKAEGLTDANLTTDRGQRSLIGVTAGQELIMATVPNCTIAELGQIAKQMGLQHAINLDGGASSGLYYDGEYLTKPGRKVANAIVVTKTTAGKNVSRPSSWALKEIQEAMYAGLLPSDMQNQYQAPITRQEFCRLAVNAFEMHYGCATDTYFSYSGKTVPRGIFSDTHDPSVENAAALKIVNGRTANLFAPRDAITRQEAAAMLMRTAQIRGMPPPKSVPMFRDSAYVATWALEAVDFVAGHGIMQGNDSYFLPIGTYSREQAYLTILRLFKKM